MVFFKIISGAELKRASEIACAVKDEWVAPQPAAIHWDGKIKEGFDNKYQVDDRLPKLISGKTINDKIIEFTN